MEDKEKQEKKAEAPGSSPLRRVGGPNVWIFLIVLAVMAAVLFTNQGPKRQEIPYDSFFLQLKEGNIAEITSVDDFEKIGTFKKEPLAPPVYKEGRWTEQKDKKGEPLLLQKYFVVEFDPQISDEERERLSHTDRVGRVCGRPLVAVGASFHQPLNLFDSCVHDPRLEEG